MPKKEWQILWGSHPSWIPSNTFSADKFDGDIDEFLVYSRKLSDNELLCLADKCEGTIDDCEFQGNINGERTSCLTTISTDQISLTVVTKGNAANGYNSPVSTGAYNIPEYLDYLQVDPAI